MLNDVDMIFNIDKCKFFEIKIRFLDHIIFIQNIKFDFKNAEKIMNWSISQIITNVYDFNNFVIYYKWYISWLLNMTFSLFDL